MTEQELNKLIHANEQMLAFMQDWFSKLSEDSRSMIYLMITEQKNVHTHLNNQLQSMILIMAQMKLAELWQESIIRSKEDV